MPGGHHPRRTVQHRTEVIPLAQLGLAGRQPHPHRQLQRPLRSHRRIHCGSRRGEGGAHPVAGVLEHEAPVRLNRPAQHLVMGGQRRPHRIGVGLPPTGRTLDIGEQKRHHPRRSSRPISGHPRRISQQTAPTSHIGGSASSGPEAAQRAPNDVRRADPGRSAAGCADADLLGIGGGAAAADAAFSIAGGCPPTPVPLGQCSDASFKRVNS